MAGLRLPASLQGALEPSRAPSHVYSKPVPRTETAVRLAHHRAALRWLDILLADGMQRSGVWRHSNLKGKRAPPRRRACMGACEASRVKNVSTRSRRNRCKVTSTNSQARAASGAVRRSRRGHLSFSPFQAAILLATSLADFETACHAANAPTGPPHPTHDLF